jgi:hypothetical protein
MSPVLAIRDAVDAGDPNPQGRVVVAVSILFGIVATIFVFIRWITRIRVYKLIGADDWFILAALVSDLNTLSPRSSLSRPAVF